MQVSENSAIWGRGKSVPRMSRSNAPFEIIHSRAEECFGKCEAIITGRVYQVYFGKG